MKKQVLKIINEEVKDWTQQIDIENEVFEGAIKALIILNQRIRQEVKNEK